MRDTHNRATGVFAVQCAMFILIWSVAAHHQRFQNQVAISRQDFLHALTVHGEWFIDRYHENTPDKAYANQHYYSDKAPGTSFLLLPVYWLGTRALSAMGVDLESARAWRILDWVSVALMFSSVLSYAVFRAVQSISREVRPGSAWILVAGVALGGMPIVYSGSCFSHCLVFSALTLALVELGLFSQDRCPQTAGLIRGGMWLGLALASEYTVGVTVVAIALYACRQRAWRKVGALLVGLALPCLMIPIYSYLTIGNAFQLPYSYQASFPQMQEGLYGIRAPSVRLAWILLFSPERGLFYWSPVLMPVLAGLYWMARSQAALGGMVAIVFLVNVVIFSGRDFDWLAGVSYGPRYLTAVVPLLLLPGVHACRAIPVVTSVIAFLSIAITGFAYLTNPMSYGDPNPFVGTMLHALQQGDVALTVWQSLLDPVTGVALHFVLLFVGCATLWMRGSGLLRQGIHELNHTLPATPEVIPNPR